MRRKRKKKKYYKYYIIVTIIIIISIPTFIFYNINSKLNKINKIPINKNNLKTSSQLQQNTKKYTPDKYIKNIVILGIDSDGNDTSRSDCIIIATIDTIHNNIKLSSIMRDSYVSIPGRNHKDKINHAYAFGGPELSLETINSNFNLDTSNYVSADFSSFPGIIDKIGGLSIELSDDEIKYINHYIDEINALHETNSPHINSSGIHALNGTQVLAYSRIRYTYGGDFERSHRHRKILCSIKEKLKNIPYSQYNSLLNELLPNIKTNMTNSEILKLSKDIYCLKDCPILEKKFPEDEDGYDSIINNIYYYTFDEKVTKEKMYNFIFEN